MVRCSARFHGPGLCVEPGQHTFKTKKEQPGGRPVWHGVCCRDLLVSGFIGADPVVWVGWYGAQMMCRIMSICLGGKLALVGGV